MATKRMPSLSYHNEEKLKTVMMLTVKGSRERRDLIMVFKGIRGLEQLNKKDPLEREIEQHGTLGK